MQSLNGKRKMNFAWPIVAKNRKTSLKPSSIPLDWSPVFVGERRPVYNRLSSQAHPSLVPDASVPRPRRIRPSPQTRTRLGLCVPTGIGNGFDIRIITRKRPVPQELVADTASTLP